MPAGKPPHHGHAARVTERVETACFWIVNGETGITSWVGLTSLHMGKQHAGDAWGDMFRVEMFVWSSAAHCSHGFKVQDDVSGGSSLSGTQTLTDSS